MLNEVKEGVQCMRVKLFACKAAWLNFRADRPTPTNPPQFTFINLIKSRAPNYYFLLL